MTTHRTFTSCTGPCDQGRKICPSPLACEREDDGSLDPSRGILVALGIVAGIVVFVLSAHWMLAHFKTIGA